MVQFPVTEAPEILLPSGPHDIMLLSRYDTSLIDFTNKKVIAVYRNSYRSFIEGLQEGFADIDYLSLSLADTIIQGKWYTPESAQFPDSVMIPTLLTRFPAAYLLTLDAMELDKDQEMEVTENDDGSKDRRAHYDLIVSIALAMYDRQGHVVDKVLMTDQEFINDRSVISGLLAVGPNIGNYSEVALPVAHDLGYEFASMFVQQETMAMRMFHSGKVFKQAATQARNGNWHQAGELLLPFTENSDTKIAKQAAHNMAIISEAQGNFTAMKKWQQRSE